MGEMVIQAIFTDLDETLLRQDKTISPYTQGILRACREKGALLFAATARPPRVVGELPSLELDGAVCHNGGVAQIGGETVWEYGMQAKTVVELAQEILKRLPATTLSAELTGRLYANFDVAGLWPGCPYVPWDCASLPDSPVEKLLAGVRSEEEWRRIAELLPPGLTSQFSREGLVMIQPEGVEKGKGVAAVCQRLGIPAEHAVAFGDDWSDVSMLRACGTGVAVENALPEVKAVADQVCGSNQEDGPARWLEEHLL